MTAWSLPSVHQLYAHAVNLNRTFIYTANTHQTMTLAIFFTALTYVKYISATIYSYV